MKRIIVLALVALSWGPSVAWAQPAPVEEEPAVDEENEARARALFEAGRIAYEGGDFESALRNFRDALELSRRPGLWFNIGMTAAQLRRDGEALEAFEAFLEAQPDAPNARQVRARVEVLRNTTQRDAASPPGRGGDLLPAAISLGVAGVGLVTFAVLGGLTLAEESAVAQGCGATRTCSDAEVSQLAALGLATDVSWIVALAAAATGVVLWLTMGTPSPTETSSARVVPWALPGAGGVLAEVTF